MSNVQIYTPCEISEGKKCVNGIYSQSIKRHLRNILNNMSETEQIQSLNYCIFCIKYIINPSEKIQLHVLEEAAYLVGWIRNLCKAAQIYVANNFDYYICCVKVELCNEAKVIAISKDIDYAESFVRWGWAVTNDIIESAFLLKLKNELQ